ncbi:MAG: murein biosynthesis integral membrane protein MurJ [Alphaproteobacteria bacterium]|nr:murein biosynthesis integral membrane protein MurJ [Alphaproteobacteria bacterium]
MNLFKNVITVSFFTGLSRILGMVREMFLSNILGASWISDAFVVAFKFPNFFRRFFAEGAFNAAFVPQFAGTLEKQGKEQAYILAQSTFSVMFFFLSTFCALVLIAAPVLIYVIAPGFLDTQEKITLTVTLVRLTFPFIVFVSLSALLAGVLNSFERFAAASATPILLNIFMILALLTYGYFDTQPVIALSFSVTLAGLTQLLWLYMATRRVGLSLTLTLPVITPAVKKVLRLMIPGAIGAGVMQINLLIDMILASFLASGSISYLYYADRLNQLPLSIFGVAMGTALLPQLSKLCRLNKREEALHIQENALLMSMQLTVPAAVALFFLAEPLIGLLYGHGQFGHDDVLKTAPALAAFSVGLPAYVTSKIFSATFFAVENTKTPVKIGLITLVINIILNLVLMQYYAHVGMALATSIAAWCNVILMGYYLNKTNLFMFTRRQMGHLVKVIILSFVMGFLVLASKKFFVAHHGDFIHMTLLTQIRLMVFLVTIGIGFYISAGLMMGFSKITKR